MSKCVSYANFCACTVEIAAKSSLISEPTPHTQRKSSVQANQGQE